ncbi:MAG: TIGR00295 family protein [Methanobacterium sp.]
MNIIILEDFKCSSYIIKHSNAVLKKAKAISNDFDVNLDHVEAGAILHDVGRSKTQSIYHALKGAEILKEQEFPIEIVKITERHIGAGIPKEEAIMLNMPNRDYLPVTFEEKIVAHADNLIHGTKEVSLDFVIKKWSKKMGSNHPSLERIIKLHNELFNI